MRQEGLKQVRVDVVQHPEPGLGDPLSPLTSRSPLPRPFRSRVALRSPKEKRGCARPPSCPSAALRRSDRSDRRIEPGHVATGGDPPLPLRFGWIEIKGTIASVFLSRKIIDVRKKISMERGREAEAAGDTNVAVAPSVMAKAKPTKHTAKELKAKADRALTNRGGGKEGKSDRTGAVKGGHAKYECPVCKVTAPDLKTMQAHHDSRHPKLPWKEESIKNLHDLAASTGKAEGQGKKSWIGKGPSTL